MSDDPYKEMRETMKRIDQMVEQIDDETLIYALNKIADELDTRAIKRNKEHSKKQQHKFYRSWGIIKLRG